MMIQARQWRSMVQLALKEMHDDASDQDRSLIDQMLDKLNEEHPNQQQIIQIYWEFTELWMRYGGPPTK
jgi:cellobiose-specific phosphotransferase system component IIA